MRDLQTVRGQAIRHTTLVRDWVCKCGSGLVTKWRDGWVTECASNPEHDPDSWFVSKASREIEESTLRTYQFWYNQEGRSRMAFVKDRHSEDGKIVGTPRVRRAGRIALGQQRQQGGAEALPYFIFKPYEEGINAEAMLSQVEEAIDKYTPGQDPDKPKVLVVHFPADTLDLFASSTYKLAGKDGHPRCVGDGEFIQFKLGDRNRIEISDGLVRTSKLIVDGQEFKSGTPVPCPGRSRTGRWEHCEKCRLLLSIDLQIAGLPYIWTLSTGDQAFYDQFFTVLELCAGYMRQGIVQFLPQIPLLLRREEGVRARPRHQDDDVFLTWQEMPTLSIEVHPIWRMQADAKVTPVLEPGTPVPQIEAPPWYERAKKSMPERPWEPNDVDGFITFATEEYLSENDDEDAKQNTIKIASDVLSKVYSKTLEEQDLQKALDTVFWFLFDGKPKTNAECAAIWRWARDDHGEGTVLNPNFEQEALQVLDAAFAAAANTEE